MSRNYRHEYKVEWRVSTWSRRTKPKSKTYTKAASVRRFIRALEQRLAGAGGATLHIRLFRRDVALWQELRLDRSAREDVTAVHE